MRRIRVLVVDDSVVVRKLVTDALGGDPEIEVAGQASNGRLALAKVAQVAPDAVTLDIEMPELDGLQTLAALRRTHPRLPVVMFSTLTERGARTTLEALALGASDYVSKPANVGSVQEALARVRAELIPKIKSLCGGPTPAPAPTALRPIHGPPQGRPRQPAAVVVIGVSTGGPNALGALLPALPGGLGVPVAVVQHMPAVFTRLLAERLTASSTLTVREAADGDPLRAGTVLLAPGDRHLALERNGADVRARLGQAPPENSCRPAADVLFRSAAAAYGPGVLAVVLTGMGRDGLRGCEHVKQAGGQVVVQDQATSVVWGMPGFVARAGLADAVVPLPELARELVRRTSYSRARS